jgi:hypothetical protein
MRANASTATTQVFRSWSGLEYLLTYACSIVSCSVSILVYVLSSARMVVEAWMVCTVVEQLLILQVLPTPPFVHKHTQDTHLGVF